MTNSNHAPSSTGTGGTMSCVVQAHVDDRMDMSLRREVAGAGAGPLKPALTSTTGSTSSSGGGGSSCAAVPISATMLQSITRLNNAGVMCLRLSHSSDSVELVQAGAALKQALEKANAMTFFSAHAGSLAGRSHPASHAQRQVSKNLYIYQRGEYDEGMHTYSSPLELDAACTGTDPAAGLSMHAVTATVLFNLGQLYLRLNEEQEATDAFLQALQILHMASSSTTSTNGSTSAIHVMNGTSSNTSSNHQNKTTLTNITMTGKKDPPSTCTSTITAIASSPGSGASSCGVHLHGDGTTSTCKTANKETIGLLALVRTCIGFYPCLVTPYLAPLLLHCMVQ